MACLYRNTSFKTGAWVQREHNDWLNEWPYYQLIPAQQGPVWLPILTRRISLGRCFTSNEVTASIMANDMSAIIPEIEGRHHMPLVWFNVTNMEVEGCSTLYNFYNITFNYKPCNILTALLNNRLAISMARSATANLYYLWQYIVNLNPIY